MKLGKLQTSWLLCVEKYELCITRPIKVWGECTERDSHMFVEISSPFSRLTGNFPQSLLNSLSH